MKYVKRTCSKTIQLTPKRARELREKVDEDLQRTFTEAHARKLGEMALAGDFLTGHIVVAKMGQREILANGQHQCWFVSEYDIPIHVLYEEYKVRGMEGYCNLFHAYDTEAKSRTMPQCSKAWLMGHKQFNGVMDHKLINRVRGGIEYFFNINGNNTFQGKTKRERFDRIGDFPDVIEEFSDLVKLSEEKGSRARVHSILKKVPVVSVIFGTLRADSRAAKNFWRQVLTGFFDKQDKEWPPYALYQYLTTRKIRGGGGGASTQSIGGGRGQDIGQVDAYAACVRCWNAYIEERPLQRVRGMSVNGSLPEIVKPTECLAY